ncbi:MAG: hypothetical protein ACLR23_23540 [Clostridia bacterium]
MRKRRKGGQRRGLAQGKRPPVEGVTRGAGVEKGRKGGPEERAMAKENARR